MTDEPLAGWSEATPTIGSRGLERARTATEAEKAEIVAALSLVSLSRLEVTYRIRRLGDERYQLSGRLRAGLEQACVVTCEPVAAELDEPFDVEYRAGSSEHRPSALDDEIEVLSAPEIEPLMGGTIDVGRIVFETLAAALPAYPRRPDAKLETDESRPAAPAPGPFAALSDWPREG